MTPEQREQFTRELEIDFAISEPGLGRFRVNVFHQRGNLAMVMRYITPTCRQLEQLGLPEILKDLIMLQRGLILMVGATGSGKSTTLAAMIDHRNENSSGHIVTIEDPIEFLHTNKRSIVNQREVGLDTQSLPRALRSAMRAAPGRDPDRRDPRPRDDGGGDRPRRHGPPRAGDAAREQLAPRRSTASSTCSRSEQHKQILLDLSQYLRAIISQRLVRSKDGKRVAAVEVMLNTPHIQELIKKGDVSRRSRKRSTRARESAACRASTRRCSTLYRQGRIELEEALSNADSRANLEAKINFG